MVDDERRPRSWPLLLLTGLIAAALAGGLHFSGALDGLEAETLDWRFAVRGEETAEGITIVALDEESVVELGQWPIPRTHHAHAVDRLREAGAELVVYDVQFTEPSGDDEADLALSDAFEELGRSVLAASTTDAQGNTRVMGGAENLRRIGARAGAA